MVQCRNRDRRANTQGCIDVGGHATGDRTIPEPMDGREDVIGVHRCLRAALNNGLLDQLHRVFGEQLQDPNILPRAARESFPLLEVGS
jgi:hypothetical protein